MRISFHGGQCCGIKSISGLSYTPNDIVWSKSATSHISPDRQGSEVNSSMDFYAPARPKEKASERFVAYMDYLREHRPQGLVEVTIVPYCWSAFEHPRAPSYKYQADWIPFLEEQGFTKVCEVANSNSGNIVQVWHYIMKEDFDYVGTFAPDYDDEHEYYYDDEDEDN